MGNNIPSVVKRALLVLEAIIRACPALLTALTLAARVKFITGDVKGAATSLQHVLDNIGQSFDLKFKIYITDYYYHLFFYLGFIISLFSILTSFTWCGSIAYSHPVHSFILSS